MTCGNMYGWLESGQQFNFSTQYDIVLRTATLSNKILIGNSNVGAAGLYIYGNNIGIHKVPLSNALDISGSMLIDSQITVSNPIMPYNMPSFMNISSSNMLFSLSNQANTYMDTSGVISSKLLVSSNLQQFDITLSSVFITSSVPNSFTNPIDNTTVQGYLLQIPVSNSSNFIIGTVFSINYIYFKVINTQTDATYLYIYAINLLPEQSYLGAPFTLTLNDINIYQNFSGSGSGYGYTVYEYQLFTLTNVISLSGTQTKLMMNTSANTILKVNSYYHFKTNISNFALTQQPRFIYKLVSISPTNLIFELPFVCADPLLSIQNTVGNAFPCNLYIFAVNVFDFSMTNQINITSQQSISSSNISFNNISPNSIYDIYYETYIGFNAFVVDNPLYRTYSLANISDSNLTLQYIPLNLQDTTNIQTDYTSITSFPRQLQILPFKLSCYIILAPQGIDAVTLAGLSIGFSNNNINKYKELLTVNGCASFMNNVFIYDKPVNKPVNLSYYNDEFSIQSNIVQINTLNSNVYFQNKTIEIVNNASSNITTTSYIYSGSNNVVLNNIGTIQSSLCIADTFMTPTATLVLYVNNIVVQSIIHPLTKAVNNNGFILHLGHDTYVEYFNTDDIIQLNNTDYLIVWSVYFDLITLSTVIEGIVYYNFIPKTLSFNIGATIPVCLFENANVNVSTNTNTNANLSYVQTTLTMAENYVASNSIVEINISININSSVSLLQTYDHFAIYSSLHDILSNTPMPIVYRKISISNPGAGGIYLMRLQSLNSKDDVSTFFSQLSAVSNQLFIYPLKLYNDDYEIDPHVQIGYFLEGGICGYAIRKSSVLSQYFNTNNIFAYPFQNIDFVRGHHTLVSFQIDVNEHNLISSVFTSNNVLVLVPDSFNQNNIVVYADADIKFRLNGIPFFISNIVQISPTIFQISSNNLINNVAKDILEYVDGFAIIYNNMSSVYWHITNIQLIAGSQIILTIECASPTVYNPNIWVLIQFVMFNKTSIHGKNVIDDLFRGRVGISMPKNMTEVLTVNGDISCRTAFNMYDQFDLNNSNPYTIMCQSNALSFKTTPHFDHGLIVDTCSINKYGEIFTDLVCATDSKKKKQVLNNINVFYYEINALDIIINIDISYYYLIQPGNVIKLDNIVLFVTDIKTINGLFYIYAKCNHPVNSNWLNQTHLFPIITIYSDILTDICNSTVCKILSRYLDTTYRMVNVTLLLKEIDMIYDYDYFIFSVNKISSIYPNTIWKKNNMPILGNPNIQLTLNNLLSSVIPLSTFSIVQDMYIYPLESIKIDNIIKQDFNVVMSFYTDGTSLGISLQNAVYLQAYFNSAITINVFEFIEFYDENTNTIILSLSKNNSLQIFRKDPLTLVIFYGAGLGMPTYSNINIRYKFSCITAPILNCVALNTKIQCAIHTHYSISSNTTLFTISDCTSYWNVDYNDDNVLILDNLDGTNSNILLQKYLFFIPFKLLNAQYTNSKIGVNSPDTITETLSVNGNLSLKDEVIFVDKALGNSKIHCECKEIIINDSMRFTDNGIQTNETLYCQNGITAVNGNLYCTQNQNYFTISNSDPISDLDYITNLKVNTGYIDSNLQSFDYMLDYTGISNLNSNIIYAGNISEWVHVYANNIIVFANIHHIEQNDVLKLKINNTLYNMVVIAILQNNTFQLDNTINLIPNSSIFVVSMSRNTVMINYKDMMYRLVNCIQLLKSDMDIIKATTTSNATFITNSATSFRTKTVVLL